jgi:holo-[acyl-carrier protein] synthase
MSAGVGIDLIEVDRVERALERRPSLAGRLFSADELAYCRRHGRPGRHLAARFAAKEATVKALGLDHFSPSEIEVVAGKPPTLRLHGAAAAAAAERGLELQLSLSHAGEMAAAVVVADAA